MMQRPLFRIATPHERRLAGDGEESDEVILPDGQQVLDIHATTPEVLHLPLSSSRPQIMADLLVQAVMVGERVDDEMTSEDEYQPGYVNLAVFTRWLDRDRVEWVYEDGLEFGNRLQPAKSEMHRRVYVT